MENFLDKLLAILTNAGGKIVLAIIVFIVGKFVINKLMKAFNKAKFVANMDATASKFILSAIRVVLYVVLIVSIIGILGVPMASVVAVIASCGLAVGMALQGALGNLAGGIMLLIFRPFNVGDYVSAAGGEGTVQEISMFYTVLLTVDNKKITIPNGSLMNANVENFSSEDNRRVDLTFNLGGGNDISKVQEVMLGVMNANDKVLQEPAPFAAPLSGIPGGLQYTVRAWCKSADYWDVYFALQKDIATAIGEAGFAGPAPTTTVVMNK